MITSFFHLRQISRLCERNELWFSYVLTTPTSHWTQCTAVCKERRTMDTIDNEFGLCLIMSLSDIYRLGLFDQLLVIIRIQQQQDPIRYSNLWSYVHITQQISSFCLCTRSRHFDHLWMAVGYATVTGSTTAYIFCFRSVNYCNSLAFITSMIVQPLYHTCTPIDNGLVLKMNEVLVQRWILLNIEILEVITLNRNLSFNFSGAMIFDLDDDDAMGSCGNGSFPLINAVKRALMRKKWSFI